MTDATNRKLDVKDNELGDIARDDPLYELSQIIGFSRPAETEHPRSAQEEHVDLEQELLRELDNFPVSGRSSAEAPDYQEYSEPERDEPAIVPEQAPTAEPLDFESEFERDFGGVFKTPEPARPEPAAPEPVVDMDEPDPMEAELSQPDFEPALAPRPVFAEAPRFVPEPEPAPQPAADSLEDELLDLLGSIGEKANAPWAAEQPVDDQIVVDEPVALDPLDFEDYVAGAEADEPELEAVADTPATAPPPLWFDEPDQAGRTAVEAIDEPATELEPDEDSALLDAFESELSEGLSISLDEMSQEETEEGAPAGFSIEDELDLDRTYETSDEIEDEDAAVSDIETAASEIASAARPSMPPVLETSDLSAGDMEAMHPLDLPQQAAEETRSDPNGIERELDAALTGYDQYEDEPAPRFGTAATAMPAASYDLDAIENDLARDMDYVAHDLEARSAEDDDLDGFEDEFDEPVMAPQPPERQRSGRGMMIAAVVGGVAILGAIGAFALMGGDVGDDGGPVLVKADPDPVKIVPEDPGGKEVPNQDRAVYGEVDGNGENAPTQDTLVSTSEEPIDLNGGSTVLPSGITETAKVEDRLMPESAASDGMSAAADDGQALLPPRRVRTVIVKPDGSFVPTPALQPAATAEAQPAPAPQTAEAAVTQPEASQPAETGTQASAAAEPQEAKPDETEALQQMASVSETETTAAPEPAETASRNIPTPTVIPERPVDQPVQVASQPAAAAAPAPTVQTQPAVPGGYMVQISSQPSAELAQQSATDLSRRFAGILGGRAISIQQAEIEGRGTFHRVRVGASGRDDAVALCESLKRAGGSCFVTR